MNYLHYELPLEAGETVEVELDQQANVQLLDRVNYDRYRNRQRFQYHGGLAKKSPFRIVAPSAGDWHLVIDLGGYAGSVRASVNTLKTH